MQNQFCDGYSVGFGTFDEMRAYHEELSRESLWLRCAVRELRVMPVTSESAPWYGYAPCVSEDSVADTAQNLGLAVRVCGEAYPAPDGVEEPARPGEAQRQRAAQAQP